MRLPLGGMAWHYLQYPLGLASLGHDVYYLEDSGDFQSCYDPARHITDADPNFGLDFTGQAFSQLGLTQRWAYFDAHDAQWHGPCGERSIRIAADADLLINVSGSVSLRPWLMEIPRRAFIDTDPLFTQVRHLADPKRKAVALQHNSFFSFGENLALSKSTVPDDGLPWQRTRQPIVLKQWPYSSGARDGKFTTIMQWSADPPCSYRGRSYGMKSNSFAPYCTLPAYSGERFEIALGTPAAPRKELESRGWQLRDPLAVTRTLWTYQQYIRDSKAEFSVARHGYVAARTGWFSERSACYLATGRPVLLQDTGFPEFLDTGSGLLTFGTREEAIHGIEEINRRYEYHCGEARALAEDAFDAKKILASLVERAMSGS